MLDRGFNELDLRLMLESPRSIRASRTAGRWILEVEFGHKPWEVIVEPDETAHELHVVTAYSPDS